MLLIFTGEVTGIEAIEEVGERRAVQNFEEAGASGMHILDVKNGEDFTSFPEKGWAGKSRRWLHLWQALSLAAL